MSRFARTDRGADDDAASSFGAPSAPRAERLVRVSVRRVPLWRLWSDRTRPVAVDDDGEVLVDCACPFDWEPACKHAVAALLAYGARQEVSGDQVRSAADAAVADRRKRARTEVVAEHIGGALEFGTWRARSLSPTGVALERSYRVELRSVDERINHCECPDLATNRLGTCKHVEAVIHTLRKRRGRRGSRTSASREAGRRSSSRSGSG